MSDDFLHKLLNIRCEETFIDLLVGDSEGYRGSAPEIFYLFNDKIKRRVSSLLATLPWKNMAFPIGVYIDLFSLLFYYDKLDQQREYNGKSLEYYQQEGLKKLRENGDNKTNYIPLAVAIYMDMTDSSEVFDYTGITKDLEDYYLSLPPFVILLSGYNGDYFYIDPRYLVPDIKLVIDIIAFFYQTFSTGDFSRFVAYGIKQDYFHGRADDFIIMVLRYNKVFNRPLGIPPIMKNPIFDRAAVFLFRDLIRNYTDTEIEDTLFWPGFLYKDPSVSRREDYGLMINLLASLTLQPLVIRELYRRYLIREALPQYLLYLENSRKEEWTKVDILSILRDLQKTDLLTLVVKDYQNYFQQRLALLQSTNRLPSDINNIIVNMTM